MSKEISIRVALLPDLKEWVDAQAQDIGATAAIWIRMLIVAARKGHVVQFGQPAEAPRFEARMVSARPYQPEASQSGQLSTSTGNASDPDAWRGPIEDEPAEDGQGGGVDVDAIVANRVAEADASGLTAPAQPYEAFASPPGAAVLGPANGGGARSLRRPPPAYSPAMQPAHLRGLA
jgi:hypothetical protein